MSSLVRFVARRARPEAVAVAGWLTWIWVAEGIDEMIEPAGTPAMLTTSPVLSPAALATFTKREPFVVDAPVRLKLAGPAAPFTFSMKTRPEPVRLWLPRVLKPPLFAVDQPLMTTV